MKIKNKSIIITLLALIPFALCAQIPQPQNQSDNQITVSYRALTGISGTFDNTATVPGKCEKRSTTRSGSAQDDASWSSGFEAAYQHHLGTWKKFEYGASAAVGYNQLTLGGTSSSANIANTLDVDIITGRVGPYLAYPITSRLTLNASVGLAVADVNGNYSTTPGASSSHSDLLYGPYAGGGASFRVYKNWSAVGSVYYAPLGTVHETSGAQSSSLDLGNAVLIGLGVGFSF